MNITIGAMLVFATVWGLKSPDGRNEITLTDEPAPAVGVARDGKRLVDVPIALEVAGKGVLKANFVKTKDVKHDNRIETPIYKKGLVRDDGNGKIVRLGEWEVELHARNDGVAYRLVTKLGGEIAVVNEKADLVFASPDQVVWAGDSWKTENLDSFQCSWESVYEKHAVKDCPKVEDKIWYAPVTFLCDGAAMCVTESDLLDYAGWNFAKGADDRTLRGVFAKWPKRTHFSDWTLGVTDYPTRYQRIDEREDFIVKTSGSRTFPWRVFMLADNLAKLQESDIVYALATPNRIGDAAWVKPGKVAWDWWNCWNVKGVDFRSGCNTKTYEYFIDFASKTGVEYVIFDEGWSKHLKIFEYHPDVDVDHLIRYANERGVGIILWATWAQFLGREEAVCEHYAKKGVKGFKIDFMDRDDAAMVRFLEKMSAAAAKYRLVLDYHGMYKPTGLQRAYPNVLNFEGVHGLEQSKWGAGEKDMPNTDCTHVFARMLAGPMDYTPGAMRNGLMAEWKPTPSMPGAAGTRVHQMALMALFEAPLQMLCDSPSQYEANMECFTFMAATPVTWDDTVALGGEMNRYAALARRKGDSWYLAAICGSEAKDVAFDTAFLGDGVWSAEIFADGINADRDATDYRHHNATVTAGEKLAAHLAPGGGFVAKFTRSGVQVKDSGSHLVADALKPWLESGELPGAISVLYDNGIQETACMGYADVAAKRKIGLDDPFMQCSQTKGFCGVTIAILVEEGKISLDDPVAKYLPEFQNLWFVEKDNMDWTKTLRCDTNAILTVRMCLNHTGGFEFELPGKSWGIPGGGWSGGMPIRQVAAEAAGRPVLFAPGTRASYSNTGIDIGAAVVEAVTGMKWEDFLQKRVLDPLGMKDTGFWPSDEQLRHQVEMYECQEGKPAKYKLQDGWEQRPYNGRHVFASAGAGLWTTVRDQLKFYKMLMNLGLGDNGVRILKEETVKSILAVSTRPKGMGGYSLGLAAPEEDGEDQWFGHGGAWGTNCMVNWHKKQLKLWVVQLTGGPRPWDAAVGKAAEEFFNAKIDDSGVKAFTGRITQ